MTLEFEKLTDKVDEMARLAAEREKERTNNVEDLLEILEKYAESWGHIETALTLADEKADEKVYRSARPLTHITPLNAAIPAPAPPERATIVATDGSQIMPDRHAAHLYYLINIGGVIYEHGSGNAPLSFSQPDLHYPKNAREMATFLSSSGEVSVARDLREIGTLAEKTWEHRHGKRPLLSILDQRLLYWPIGGDNDKSNYEVKKWMRAMTKIHDSGGLLAGYIDRPMTTAVITLLQTLEGAETPDSFGWKELGKRSKNGGLSDSSLFSRLLKPGERSAIFTHISPRNDDFVKFDEGNQVCFFYINPGFDGRSIARIDLPLWVAEDEEAVTAVHALIYDQCQIIGDYPYVIARADEMAVVGRDDNQELNFLIDLKMQEYGISTAMTAKLGSKNLARGGRTRHGGI